MRGIIGGLTRKRAENQQFPGEFLGIRGRIDKRNAFERHDARAGRILVARSGLRGASRHHSRVIS